MPLVRVQRKGLVTVPLKLREELGLEEGDLLSVELVEGKLVYKPQVVLDREAALAVPGNGPGKRPQS
jgi:AbrB family looped-hinge helix DNA binding protein